MGLDMYAYSIKASLIGDQQTDIDIGKALGIPERRDNMTEAEENDWHKECDRIRQAAIAAGDYDPNFGYWRKFNNLHGWMERHYRMMGGAKEQFNCATVRLTPTGVAKLRQEAAALKPAAGFFWGSQDAMDKEDVEQVYDFCDKCEEASRKGHAVLYDSWY